MRASSLVFAVVVIASLSFGDDFKTTDGKEYKNVTVSRVELDGIVVITSVGVSKLYFAGLPKDVQERFHYDAAKTAEVAKGILGKMGDANAQQGYQNQ